MFRGALVRASCVTLCPLSRSFSIFLVNQKLGYGVKDLNLTSGICWLTVVIDIMIGRESTVKACVLIRVRPGQHYEVTRKILSFDGVKSAFAVMGSADVIARIEVKGMKALTALGSQIGNLPDVVTTETLVGAMEA